MEQKVSTALSDQTNAMVIILNSSQSVGSAWASTLVDWSVHQYNVHTLLQSLTGLLWRVSP